MGSKIGKQSQAVRTYCGTHGVSFSYTMQTKRYVQREYARNEPLGAGSY